MKITINEETKITKEIEIDLPFYCTSVSGVHKYKVFSETKAIEIYENRIQIVNASIAFAGGFIPCLEKEVNDAFNEVLELIKNSF
jgi:hypothetical protein